MLKFFGREEKLLIRAKGPTQKWGRLNHTNSFAEDNDTRASLRGLGRIRD
jgi:hypothetical protein